MIIDKHTKNTDLQPKDFIPILWKQWYALLKGIAEGVITKDDEDKDAETVTLRTEFGLNFSEYSLRGTINNLLFDAKESISGLPFEIYRLEEPTAVLSELDKAAEKIQTTYTAANPKLMTLSEDIRELFADIHHECAVIRRMIALYHSEVSVNLPDGYESDYGGWCDPDSFESKNVKSLYETTSGYCFSDISLESFLMLINCVADHLDMYGCKNTEDRIAPVKGREMSFYVFLIVLMLGRNRKSDERIPELYELNDSEYEIDKYWASRFTKFVKFHASAKKQSWIDYYTISDPWDNDSSLKVSEDVSSEERSILKALLGRVTFSDIYSPDELEAHNLDIYPFNEIDTLLSIAKVTGNHRDTLDKIFALLMKETNYFLQTREHNCKHFASKEYAEKYLEEIRMTINLCNISRSSLDDIFFHNYFPYEDAWAIQDDIDYSRPHLYEVLVDKPLVHRTMIQSIVDSCILNNRKTLRLLRETIDNEDYYSKITACTGGSDTNELASKQENAAAKSSVKTIEEILLELQYLRLIDEDCVILKPKSQLARTLVLKGYVKTALNWRTVFKSSHWKEYAEGGHIEEDVIKELIRGLIWGAFDGCFKYRKKLNGPIENIPSKDLYKAFYDGDRDYKQLNSIFLQLYSKYGV